MNKILINTDSYGNTQVVTPVELSINQLLKLYPSAVVVDKSDVKTEFLDVAEIKNGTVTYNILKAKEIQKNKFRQARKPILEKLDVEFMRALESGNTQKVQEITAKKQELRDITNISLPDNIEELKNTWPSILNS